MDRILESFRRSKRAKDQSNQSTSTSGRSIPERPKNQPIDEGVYTINSVEHPRFVYLEDANDDTPLRSHFRPGNRNAQWCVTFWGNNEYLIQNVDNNRYASRGEYDTSTAQTTVVGSSKEQLWRIHPRPYGKYPGQYSISTHRGWAWALRRVEPDTPVNLYPSEHPKTRDLDSFSWCWWIFQKQEIESPANENLMAQPVLFEPEPLPALAQTPVIPSDMDPEGLDSEPYLAKHFGLHVPNLAGQVRRMNKGVMFPGTYSTVYPGMYGDKKVAIKVLRMTKENDKIQRKFRRELLIWWHLKHDNVLPLYGYFKDEEGGDGFPSLISKWAEHGSAAQYIHRQLRWDQRASLFYDVAKGLKYLHTFNPLIVVIHADLKPQNVVVNINGVGQLCDFGLTRVMQEESSDLTTSTTHTGTTRYLAYELVQHQGKPIPTTATDIYALGCLGLEFIYRVRPHASLGTNYGKINYEIFSAIPPAKRPADPEEVVTLLWDLVEACWSEAPAERPTATQISDYLAVNLEALSESLEECSWEPEYPNE